MEKKYNNNSPLLRFAFYNKMRFNQCNSDAILVLCEKLYHGETLTEDEEEMRYNLDIKVKNETKKPNSKQIAQILLHAKNLTPDELETLLNSLKIQATEKTFNR